jgi:two-component system, NarL family, invasion response regulator UvrY
MMRILLVDDHPVVRQGLRTMLTDRVKGSVIGEARDAEEALAQATSSPWDVVIVDITLPGRSGIDLIKQLHREKPSLPTLVVSMHPPAQFARRAFGAGAIGYLPKDSSPEEFVKAIEDARRGRRYLGRDPGDALRDWTAKAITNPHDALSDREYQVLRLLGSGQTASDIARDLGLSVKTVSTYRTRVLEKLGMRTTAELMRYALENGLVDS